MIDDTTNRPSSERLGAYLKSLRMAAGMSLRDVEEATKKEISNAYLSQLENGLIASPSPHMLHSLASVYHAPYEKLMERAGYIAPSSARQKGAKHGRAATFSVDNLTEDEEKELLKYLSWFRSRRGKT